MNKVFLGLILTVCVLGMALVMLNDRLGRKQDTRTPPATVERPLGPPRELAEITEARERQQAIEALSPPARERDLSRTYAPEIENKAQEAPQDIQVISPADPKPDLPGAPAKPPVAVVPEMPKALPETKPSPVRQPESRPEAPKATPAQKPEPVKPAIAQKPDVKPDPPKMSAAKPEPPKVASAEKTATRFVVYARDKGATVRIGGNAKVEYSSMTLEDPNRVVVDLTGHWKFPPNLGIPKNDLVSAVRVGQNGDKTRVVIDLKAQPRKVILVPFKNGDGVDVRVDK